MRNLNLLDVYRNVSPKVVDMFGSIGDHTCGVFKVDDLCIIASSGEGWDHVSVSLANRCPTWEEMEKIKRLFFKDDETAMQLHVHPSKHISFHPFCLHLWRPTDGHIPCPPPELVGAPK